MATAYLMMRISLDGAKPSIETIQVANSNYLTVISNKQLWLELARATAPQLQEATRLVLEQARRDHALSALLERLYVPPALPRGADLMAQMREGRRGR